MTVSMLQDHRSQTAAPTGNGAKHIPLSHFRFPKNTNTATKIESQVSSQVFRIKCKPKMFPLDVNVEWLMGQAWNPLLDRFRFSGNSVFIRKFEPSNDKCVIVQLLASEQAILVLSNDEEMASSYLSNLFLGNFMKVKLDELNVIDAGLGQNVEDIMFFCGSIHSAFNIWANDLIEQQLSSRSSR